MSLSDSMAYGYGRKSQFWGWWTPQEYQLFGTPKLSKLQKAKRGRQRPDDWQGVILLGPYHTRVPYSWKRDVPFFVRSMVLAGDKLVAAGPPDVVDETKLNVGELMHSASLTHKRLDHYLAAWRGENGGRLWIVSAADGNALQKEELDYLPVFDGMAVADEKLYISTKDGRLVCLGDGQE